MKSLLYSILPTFRQILISAHQKITFRRRVNKLVFTRSVLMLIKSCCCYSMRGGHFCTKYQDFRSQKKYFLMSQSEMIYLISIVNVKSNSWAS